MSEKKIYLNDLYFDHKMWLNELAFYKEEMVILQNRLDEVAERNTAKDMKAVQGQMQSKLIRQKEVLDILEHDITLHQQELVQFAKDHPIALDHVMFTDHTAMRDRMDIYKKIYAEMKNDFQDFVAEWL
jgi:hypothetical protein